MAWLQALISDTGPNTYAEIPTESKTKVGEERARKFIKKQAKPRLGNYTINHELSSINTIKAPYNYKPFLVRLNGADTLLFIHARHKKGEKGV